MSLSVVDPNGNYYTVGTTTSDSSGAFKLAFTPEVPGNTQSLQAFAGSGSYYGSSAETAVFVDEAAATATPQPTPAPSAADLYFVPGINRHYRCNSHYRRHNYTDALESGHKEKKNNYLPSLF